MLTPASHAELSARSVPYRILSEISRHGLRGGVRGGRQRRGGAGKLSHRIQGGGHGGPGQ